MKKQKHDFQVCFVDRVLDIEKIVEDNDSQFTKRSTKVANEQFSDNMKEKKLTEPEEKKQLAQNLKTFYVEARKKEFVQCVIKQFITFVFCDLQSSRGLGKGYQPQPSASVDNPSLDLDYSGSNDCLVLTCITRKDTVLLFNNGIIFFLQDSKPFLKCHPLFLKFLFSVHPFLTNFSKFFNKISHSFLVLRIQFL